MPERIKEPVRDPENAEQGDDTVRSLGDSMAEYEANPNGSSREYEWKEIVEGDKEATPKSRGRYERGKTFPKAAQADKMTGS
jgi:hypothetical protein